MKTSTWVMIGIGIIAMAFLNLALQRMTNPTDAAPPQSTIKVSVTSQDAGGYSQSDMNVDFLKNYEAWSKGRMAELAKARLSDAEFKTLGSFQSKANFVEQQGLKLALFRLRFANARTHIVQVVGFVDAEQKTVSCTSESSDFPPVVSGLCGDKIAEVFGVNLGPTAR